MAAPPARNAGPARPAWLPPHRHAHELPGGL